VMVGTIYHSTAMITMKLAPVAGVTSV